MAQKPEPVMVLWLDADTPNEGWAEVTDDDGSVDAEKLVPSVGYIASRKGLFLQLAGEYDPATLSGEHKEIHFNRILRIPHGMVYDILSMTTGKSIMKKKRKKK